MKKVLRALLASAILVTTIYSGTVAYAQSSSPMSNLKVEVVAAKLPIEGEQIYIPGSISEDLIAVESGGKYGYVDLNGKIVLPLAQYDPIGFQNDFLLSDKGIYNTKGALVTKWNTGMKPNLGHDIDHALIGNGLIPFYIKDASGKYKYGYVKTNGNVAIPTSYDAAFPFSGGYGVVQKDGHSFIINTKNERCSPNYMSNAYPPNGLGGGYMAGRKDISDLSKLIKLTTLDLMGNQIIDISPLEHLTNLTTLNISQNQISNINPLAGLTKLRFLDVGNNKISDIGSLAMLTDLKVLLINANQVSNITPIAKLMKLTEKVS